MLPLVNLRLADEGRQIIFCRHFDLNHKPPDSGERQYKSKNLKGRFEGWWGGWQVERNEIKEADLEDRLALHPAPCTLHPAPCTLHPAPCTLHPAPCTLHPAP